MVKSVGWWDMFPKNPWEAITRSFETPTVSPLGLFGIGGIKKVVTKLPGLLIGGGLGLLFGSLFGGGGTQEQKQAATVSPVVTPIQDIKIPITQKPVQYTYAPITTTTSTKVDYSPIHKLTAGGDIGYYSGGLQVGTTTTPTVAPSQSVIAEPFLPQITVIPTSIGQEQTATQKPDNTLLLVIGAVAIGAMFLMKGK